jgi:hypothetical protein
MDHYSPMEPARDMDISEETPEICSNKPLERKLEDDFEADTEIEENNSVTLQLGKWASAPK